MLVHSCDADFFDFAFGCCLEYTYGSNNFSLRPVRRCVLQLRCCVVNGLHHHCGRTAAVQMQCFICAIFFHEGCHFGMSCANAVPTTVNNHHDGFGTILRNTKSCSGLSARCYNVCRRCFLTVQQQQSAAAKSCVDLVKVDGRAYL